MEITIAHLIGFIFYLICWSLFLYQRSNLCKYDIPIFDCEPLYSWWIIIHIIVIFCLILGFIPWSKVLFKF